MKDFHRIDFNMVPYQLVLQIKSSAVVFPHLPPLSSHNGPHMIPLTRWDWSPPASNTQSSLFHLRLFPVVALSRRAFFFPLSFFHLNSPPASVNTQKVRVLCAKYNPLCKGDHKLGRNLVPKEHIG